MRENLKLKCVVNLLLLLQILVGVMFLAVTGYYHFMSAKYLAKSELGTILNHLTTIYLLGVEVIVCCSIGFFVLRFIWKTRALPEDTRLIYFWMGFCVFIYICGSLIVWFFSSSSEYLQKAAAESLFQGMDLYFFDPEWKLIWDEIQFHNDCCGVFSFKDWKEAAWVNEDQETDQSAYGASMSMVLVPYACCKRLATSCFQNFVPFSKTYANLYQNTSDINTNGCLPKLKFLLSRFHSHILSIWLAICILQLLLTLLIKISNSNKIIFCMDSCLEYNDERPVVLVKYPHNVRCITLSDGNNFDTIIEQEEERSHIYKCSGCLTANVTTAKEGRSCLFVH